MRYALGVEYDGSGFSGWQRLNKAGEPERRDEPTCRRRWSRRCRTVADAPGCDRLRRAHRCRRACGLPGRAFRQRRGRAIRAAGCSATTSRLPRCGAACAGACRSPDDFHARFAARARRYRYRILNRAVRPALGRQYLSWERRAARCRRRCTHAAQALLGEHDFSAFRTVHCQAPHARRDLQAIRVARDGDEVVDRCAGQRFPASHGAQHRRFAAGGRRWRTARSPGSRNCSPAATAPSPARPRRRPGCVFLGPLYPAHWNLPAEVTCSREHDESTLFRTRIKFCGMTRAGDVRLASELGVDAIGFVFAAGSPRRMRAEEARAMRNALAPLVDAVALFMDNAADEVARRDQAGAPEPAAVPRQRGRRLLPQFRRAVHQGDPDGRRHGQRRRCDRTAAALSGGRGVAVRRARREAAGRQRRRRSTGTRVPTGLRKPFVLAGGLHAGQRVRRDPADPAVGRGRLQRHRKSRPGSRTATQMRHFVEEVRRADCHAETESMPTQSATVRHRTAQITPAYPDASGHFGRYGGRFVAETLIGPLEELAAAYDAARVDPAFIAEFERDLAHYVGRPSPIYHASA